MPRSQLVTLVLVFALFGLACAAHVLAACALMWLFGPEAACVYVAASLLIGALLGCSAARPSVRPGRITPRLIAALRERAAQATEPPSALDVRHRRPLRLRPGQWPQPEIYLGGSKAGEFSPADHAAWDKSEAEKLAAWARG